MTTFYSNLAGWILLVLILFIFIYPTADLIMQLFDWRLFVLTIFLVCLSCLGYWKYLNFSWQSHELLPLFSLIMTILFFVSSSSQRDLSILTNFRAINTYNCNIALAILQNKDKDPSTIIAYNYYSVDFYSQNLGFFYEKFGVDWGQRVQQLIYDFTYSNNLLDNIAQLNQSTQSREEVDAMARYNMQQIAFANKINVALCRRLSQ